MAASLHNRAVRRIPVRLRGDPADSTATDADTDTDTDTDTGADTDADTGTDTDTDTETDRSGYDPCAYECRGPDWCSNNGGTVHDDMWCDGDQICCEVP